MVECGRKSVGCPSWDQGDPPFSGQAAWRQGHGWLVCGLKDGDLGRRGSLTPPCSLGWGMSPVPAPAMACGQNQLLSCLGERDG